MVPRKKRQSCFGLISPHQQSILHPYLQAPRVYKAEQWHCTCGYEMRFIPTRLFDCYALRPSINGLEPRLRPTLLVRDQYKPKPVFIKLTCKCCYLQIYSLLNASLAAFGEVMSILYNFLHTVLHVLPYECSGLRKSTFFRTC